MNDETWAILLKIYDAAIVWLGAAYEGAEFTQWLDRAALVDVVNGVFVIEAPCARAYNLFTRHSEQIAIRSALQAAMPRDWNWTIDIQFTVGQGRQIAQGLDYMELEGEAV